MKKEDVFETIKKIINECGFEEIIIISTKEFEMADFHIVDDLYLGYNGRKLFKFSDIKRISYCNNDVFPVGRYSGTEFVLIIDFDKDKEFHYEFGDDGDIEWIFANGNVVEFREFAPFFNDYHMKQSIRDEIINSLDNLELYRDDCDLESAEVWYHEAVKYMQENKGDNDELFFSVVTSAYKYKDVEQDFFDLKALVAKLVEMKKVYPYLWHVRERWGDIWGGEDIKKCENYFLKLKNEIETTIE